MKLATLNNGRPDGQLVVVSADMKRFVSAGRIAATLQGALDDWAKTSSLLEDVSRQLNGGEIAGQTFDVSAALAPLPRAFQWIDGAGYLGHLERVRALKGSVETLQSHRPLLYQGGSDTLLGATQPIILPEDNLGVDFEGELAVITGPVPMGADRDVAADAIRLITLCNDVSLRRLVSDDLQDGFGFFHSKPSTSFAPVVVTPDELGAAWSNNRLSARLEIDVNAAPIGRLQTGEGVHFDFADLLVAATRTRALGAGTILGSGTVANSHEDPLPLKRGSPGFGCFAEARTVEKIKFGKARTPFLQHGDEVRMDIVDENGRSVFGAITQKVHILNQ